MQTLDQAELRRLFDYDPLTGIVTRRVCTNSRHCVGEKVGTLAGAGYLQATAHSQKHYLHRMIWAWVYGVWPTQCIDHINQNKLDNRLANLREVTHAENLHNMKMKASNGSGYVGVCFDPRRRRAWTAYISVKGKTVYLGSFPTPVDANAARVRAKRIYHPTAPAVAGA